MIATTATLRSGGLDLLSGLGSDLVDERQRALDLHRHPPRWTATAPLMPTR